MNQTIETYQETETLTNDDAAWVLLCAFLIFSMQTGFALLEAGCVSSKNVTNIMIKNAVDVMFGGIAYWIFGYALSFGEPSNAFCGFGGFFFRTKDDDEHSVGSSSAHYFFQLSFATTSTTIVSGAVAERMKLHSYMVFAFFNTIVYSIPASWAWGPRGFLAQLGYFDYAGTSVVHLSGGTAALVATLCLGPRMGRFSNPDQYKMSSPMTAMTGTFMLWWAWLGFNAGSSFNISNDWWRVSTSAAVTTLNGSIGGGIASIILSMLIKKNKILVEFIIGGILGGLVAITGIAAVVTTWESIFIGAIGGIIAVLTLPLVEYLKIDDPVGAIPVHFFAAIWGTLVVGLCGRTNVKGQLEQNEGLFRSGNFRPLGVQLLGAVAISVWSGICSFVMCQILKYTIGLRVTQEEEMLGADLVEHNIKSASLSERLELSLMNIVNEQGSMQNAVKLLADEIVKDQRENLVEPGHPIFDFNSQKIDPSHLSETNEPTFRRVRVSPVNSSNSGRDNDMPC